MKVLSITKNVFAAGSLAAVSIIGISGPANAASSDISSPNAESIGCGPFCGRVHHHSPDVGYSRAFTIRCDGYETNHYVKVGQSSLTYCHDTGKIFVHKGEQILCDVESQGFAIKWDSYGWHDVTNANNEDCIAQTD